MARPTDLPTGQTTFDPSTRSDRRVVRRRIDRSTLLDSHGANPDPGYQDLAEAIRAELSPSGPIESVLVEQIVASTWRMQTCGASPTEDPEVNEVSRAGRLLRAGLRALIHVRALQVSPLRDTLPPQVFQPQMPDDSSSWKDRLTWDDAVSEDSPIVRGTWITVGQVVSRIIDGWTWADLLRAHPELCEDDLRACIAFTVEDENAR